MVNLKVYVAINQSRMQIKAKQLSLMPNTHLRPNSPPHRQG